MLPNWLLVDINEVFFSKFQDTLICYSFDLIAKIFLNSHRSKFHILQIPIYCVEGTYLIETESFIETAPLSHKCKFLKKGYFTD